MRLFRSREQPKHSTGASAAKSPARDWCRTPNPILDYSDPVLRISALNSVRDQRVGGYRLAVSASGNLPRQVERRAAADVSLADFDSMTSRAQVDTALVVTFVDRAGIANHFRAINRYPSRIVHFDREFVAACARRDQLAGPDVAGRERHRS